MFFHVRRTERMECVRSIITLGSPVSVAATGSQSPNAVKALYRLVSRPWAQSAHVMQPRAKAMRESRRFGYSHQLPVFGL